MTKAKIKQFKIELILINEKVLVTFSFFLLKYHWLGTKFVFFQKTGVSKVKRDVK